MAAATAARMAIGARVACLHTSTTRATISFRAGPVGAGWAVASGARVAASASRIGHLGNLGPTMT